MKTVESYRDGETGVVGMVSPRYWPSIGGVEKHVEMIAKGLVERQIRVEVITTDFSGKLPAVEEKDGILIRRFPTLGNENVYLVAPALGRWLLKNGSRYGLLHAHSYHAPLALQAAVAGRKHRVPMILTSHYHGTGHGFLQNLLHIPYRFFGQWMIKQARKIIYVSQSEQRLLAAHFGSQLPSMVIPNGIDPDLTTLRAGARGEQAGVRVLSIGRLEGYKRVDRIVTAVPHLPSAFELVILGDGAARETLAQQIAAQQVAERVRLLGHVPLAELHEWFGKAAVFVALSEHEAFGISVLEAAATGLPVVASDIPAHREIADYVPADRITFVPADCSPEQLAQTIEAAAQKGVAAETASWPLPTWPRVVDSLIHCYQTVLSQDVATRRTQRVVHEQQPTSALQ